MASDLPLVATPTPACCAPLTDAVISADEATSLAAKFKAIGDPTRLRLLSMVAASESGEACVCDLNDQLDLSQGTVSHHLGLLVKAELLTRTKRGTWSYYTLVPGALTALGDALRT